MFLVIYVKIVSKMTTTKLSLVQHEVLVGILLGDASFQTDTKGEKYRLRVSQSEGRKEYLFHLYDLFQNLCTSPPVRYEFMDPRNPLKKYFRWSFATTQQSCFRFYGKQFYNGKVKKVPTLIHKWLQPRSIAYWYMDDGAHKWKGKSLAVRFCTDNFTKSDVKRLANLLQNRYKLKTSLQKKDSHHRIYISSYSYPVLRTLIYSFFIESMLYKFPSDK